jgi:UDP:flavonoid glycosyltransferase YjiC (YdhE family)
LRTCILTIGTRGDVQPYIALGLGLSGHGHDVTIATQLEFGELVRSHGLQHSVLRGDFVQAAKDNAGHPLRQVRAYKEIARDTLADEWVSAKNADVLIYNPAALGGFHIAEALGIPGFAAFPTPLYTPTREFPTPFFPFGSLGPLNRLSHELLARIGPSMYGREIGDWRRDVLGLPRAKGERVLRGRPVTMLYGYSETVLRRPKDWDDSTVVTGYWFLDAPADWRPQAELANFLADGPPPVYVGFGSMFMDGGVHKTEMVLRAVELSGQRCVLATGGGALTAIDAPSEVFMLDAVPHDWLFDRVAAVVHHGGAGTTGAGLRAGKPTVVCPFVGDQFFWGRCVETLGVGPVPIPQVKLSAERLAAAIRSAVSDDGMRDRAVEVGRTICAEDGVGNAVAVINQQLRG